MPKRFAVWSVLLVLTLFNEASGMSSQGRRLLVNKLAVRQVEMGYRLGDPAMRVRLHLESGLALEQELSQGTDVDYFLALARIMGSGRGRLFAEIVDDELVSIQLALP